MLRSVAFLVVGEIIENGAYPSLIEQLLSINFRVEKACFVDESVQKIASELKTLSRQCDIVIVLKKLSNRTVFRAIQTIRCVEEDVNIKNIDQLRSGMKFLHCLDPLEPVVYFQRIFVLNEEHAITQFTQKMKTHLEEYINEPLYEKSFKVQTDSNTEIIITRLQNLNINIQNIQNNGENYLINVSSNSFEEITKWEIIIREEFDEMFIDSSGSINFVQRILDSCDELVLQSLKFIEYGITYYEPENIFLSFNGGKDCTVLLHLVYSVLKKKFPDYRKPLNCVYITNTDSFKEQNDFIMKCKTFYNLRLVIGEDPLKIALTDYLKLHPNFKACFMGTRRTDPYSQNMRSFQTTDRDWPELMRINPILDWQYSDIWDYLLYYKIPYCKLYDMGYTSIGSKSNTVKNPSLLYYDDEGKSKYLPAYKLINQAEERNGRNST